MSNIMYCPKCGSKMEDSYVFCTECGENLSNCVIADKSQQDNAPVENVSEKTAVQTDESMDANISTQEQTVQPATQSSPSESSPKKEKKDKGFSFGWLWIVASVFLLFKACGSCSDDNDNGNSDSSESSTKSSISIDVVGTWQNQEHSDDKIIFNSNGAFGMEMRSSYTGQTVRDFGSWSIDDGYVHLIFVDKDLGSLDLEIINSTTLKAVSHIYKKIK